MYGDPVELFAARFPGEAWTECALQLTRVGEIRGAERARVTCPPRELPPARLVCPRVEVRVCAGVRPWLGFESRLLPHPHPVL